MATEIAPKRSPEIYPSTPAARLVTNSAAAVAISPNTATPNSVNAPGTVIRPTESYVDVIHIPSYSRWFNWNAIHECEARFVPEFFDGRSPSKNPRVYKYYRNAIIRRFRENSSRKITFTEVRKTIVGDVGSIRRVFDFLESWGLINYSSTSKTQLKSDDKGTTAAHGSEVHGSGGADVSMLAKRLCSSCKSPCTIACFVSEKHDMTLCARCYVRSNFRVGVSSSDFKRIEISEEARSDWNEKETLQLLEALLHYGDDWKKVANHVGGGRSAKECVARFIKLPFGEQYHGPPDSLDLDTDSGIAAMPNKRICLSPLADTSNPIMAQVAFLAKLVGVDVAEVAATAAVAALSDLGDTKQPDMVEPNDTANGKDTKALDGIIHLAKSMIAKEEEEQERAISGIVHQVKELEDKIQEYEELDLQMEKKRQHLQKMQNQVFVDKLTLFFHRGRIFSTKTAGSITGDTKEVTRNVNIDVQLPTNVVISSVPHL